MSAEVFTLTLLVVFVFGWNNGSVAVGSLTGPRLLTRGRALILVSLGFLLGVLAEGWKMNALLLGGHSNSDAAIATLTTILVMLTLSNLTLTPISLSNIAVGSYVGTLMNIGGDVNLNYLTLTLFAWITGPLLTFGITLTIYRVVRRLVSRMGLVSLDLFNRLAVYVIVFMITYSLSANNVGFILSLAGQATPLHTSLGLGAALSAVVGVFLMWGGIEASMAEKLVVLSPQKTMTSLFSAALVVWLFTQISVPASLTQNLMGGILGAAMTTRLRIVNTKMVGRIIVSWITTTLASVVLGYYMITLV